MRPLLKERTRPKTPSLSLLDGTDLTYRVLMTGRRGSPKGRSPRRCTGETGPEAPALDEWSSKPA